MSEQRPTEDLLLRLDQARALAEEVMKLEKTLADKRRQLNALVPGAVPPSTTEAVARMTEVPDGSLSNKILWVLKSNRGRALSVDEIFELINDDSYPMTTYRSILSRFAKKKQISSPSRGKYIFS